MKITLKEWSSITTTILGALAAFYALLAQMWHLPFATEIPATLTGLATLIASILGIFTVKKISDRKVGK